MMKLLLVAYQHWSTICEDEDIFIFDISVCNGPAMKMFDGRGNTCHDEGNDGPWDAPTVSDQLVQIADSKRRQSDHKLPATGIGKKSGSKMYK